MKKALFMATALLASLTLSKGAFADDGVTASTGSDEIIINSVNGIPLNKETFLTYRLMDATKISDTEEKYTIIPVWQKFFNEQVKGNENTECTSDEAHQYLLKLQTDPKAFRDFKEKAYDYAKEKKVPDMGSDTATQDQYKISNLPNGYYLIVQQDNDSSVSVSSDMLVTVDSANRTQTVNLKADVPSLLKTINDGSGDKKAESYGVGDEVNFQLVSKVPDISGYLGEKTAVQKENGRYVFEVCESMSKGLTLEPNSIKIKIGDKNYTNFKVVQKDDPSTPETEWKIVFGTTTVTNEGTGKPDEILSDTDGVVNDPDFVPANAGKPIVITYKAKLNENAVLGDKGNPNTANVLYSSNPYKKDDTNHTWDSTAKAYTFGLDLTKTNTKGDKLPYAGFNLKDKEGNIIYVKPLNTDNSGKDQYGKYVRCHSNDKGAQALIASGQDGKIIVSGLDAGDYQLVETDAPDGYQLLPAPIHFSITPKFNLVEKTIDAELSELTSSNADFKANKSTGYVSTTVVNKTGGLLPKTGGRGIAILVVVGVALIGIATYLLFGRRKKA